MSRDAVQRACGRATPFTQGLPAGVECQQGASVDVPLAISIFIATGSLSELVAI